MNPAFWPLYPFWSTTLRDAYKAEMKIDSVSWPSLPPSRRPSSLSTRSLAGPCEQRHRLRISLLLSQPNVLVGRPFDQRCQRVITALRARTCRDSIHRQEHRSGGYIIECEYDHESERPINQRMK
jgi:hypothetical protein